MEEIHSDWGDWLPRAVAAADPDGVTAWYLGCNGVILKASDGTTVFIDPYLGTGDPPRTIRMTPVPFHPGDVEAASAVLATHDHVDHTHGPSQAPILERTGAPFYGPPASVEEATGWLDDWDLATDQLGTVTPGERVEAGSFTVHVEDAHDPDAVDPVSYVVEHDAGTFFHGGDSKPADAFADVGERYDIDVGVVALGSQGRVPPDGAVRKWYCDPDEAAEVARDLQLDRLVPTHWDMWKRVRADPTAVLDPVRGFDYPRSVRILEAGDSIEI
ncbi:MAG: MBL fold metallo-hydrolase [Halobacteriaceae archaeon]